MSTSTYTDKSLIARGDPTTSRGKDTEVPHPDDPSASGNLDKIRDIRFGAQARRRFSPELKTYQANMATIW